MRTHGVTNFEDPHVSTNGNSVQIAVHVDPAITEAPAFKSAQRACAHILPNAGNGPTPAQIRAHTDAILAFARCMRQHGFPRFPDPNSQGQLTPAMLSAAGIDLAAAGDQAGGLRLPAADPRDHHQGRHQPGDREPERLRLPARIRGRLEPNQVVARAGVGRVVEPVLLMAAATEVAERDTVGRVAEAEVCPAP